MKQWFSFTVKQCCWINKLPGSWEPLPRFIGTDNLHIKVKIEFQTINLKQAQVCSDGHVEVGTIRVGLPRENHLVVFVKVVSLIQRLRTLSEKHLGASIKEDLFAFNVMQHVFVQIPNISLVFRLMSALPV